jgi:hypothetical protein
VLGGAHGDPRRERRHRLVADVLVDQVGRLPQRAHVDARVEPQAAKRLGQRLARDAMQRQRHRVDSARDQVRAGARRLERGREGVAARALGVDPDGKSCRFAETLHELAGAVRLQRARGVVEEHACGAEFRQLPRALDERVRLAGRA